MKWLVLSAWATVVSGLAQPLLDRGTLQMDSLPDARLRFAGLIGDRVDANVKNWLLCAPQANPGMLEMFHMRDRKPAPQLVPWAGEFVAKYLISAVQALRMTDEPQLRQQVSNVVAAFISTQAEDGYLGPFPKETRLLKNWDLWAHYHAIYALLLWYEHSGDAVALSAARKAADLVCNTYLDTGRRVFDAGDPEMNMSILTGLLMLHRATGEPRYLRMAREVERDWERTGDYLRAGLDGREFYQSPRPRWESLHDLQGLLELWRVTGDTKYREAFIHHWRSIRRWDRRNTGGFSSGEQATGNPYAPTAIETCCTVAWMALTVDYLRLTGDARAADDLELATLNAGLGAQHPSGRWWTYNTPMDGVREASAHTIVFQARAGTPELNCCSVNGPRALGMLGEWAIMSEPEGLVLNSYLPGAIVAPCRGQLVRLVLDRDYPVVDSQKVLVAEGGQTEWTLSLRVPGWSRRTRVRANFDGVPAEPAAGSFLHIRRRWKAGDEIVLEFDFGLRAIAGANEATGQVSLYRGPLLLAYDQALNALDEPEIPALDLLQLKAAAVVHDRKPPSITQPARWLEIDVPTVRGQTLRLVDFASGGAGGTRYRTWLSPGDPLPAPVFTQYPPDGERVRPGPVQFRWRRPRRQTESSCRLEVASDASFNGVLITTNLATGARVTVELPAPQPAAAAARWWRVVTVARSGETTPDVPPAVFTLAQDAPMQSLPPEPNPGPNGELILHSLRGEARPNFGELLSEKFVTHNSEGTKVNGRDQMLLYSMPAWPEEDFTVAVRVRIDEVPKDRIGQIFSAWTAGMDDPLRLVVDKGRVFARVEAGAGYGTPGVPIETNHWHQIAAVKRGEWLTLFVDGHPTGDCSVPQFATTATRQCALGGNPHFNGNEFLAATFADFGFWARALSSEELRLPQPETTSSRNARPR
ncbi:MAG TPA: beta-L-arabinofuranosidase domain-containing protein [Verrucomicrobiae bacterium]